MNVPPQVSDLTELLYGDSGTTVDEAQGQACLDTVTQLASAYTRGQGFTVDTADNSFRNSVPNADISAVILSAATRLYAHPRQAAVSETVGPDSASFPRGGFSGWTVLETIVLNRYRVTAA